MGAEAVDQGSTSAPLHGDQLLRCFEEWAVTLAALRARAAGLPDDEGELACLRLAAVTLRAYVALLEPLLDEYPGPRAGRC